MTDNMHQPVPQVWDRKEVEKQWVLAHFVQWYVLQYEYAPLIGEDHELWDLMKEKLDDQS